MPKLAKNKKHTVEVVVDRLKVRPDAKQRLAESFETALRHSDGRALAVEMDSGREHIFSARFACPVCGYSLPELEPRLFSFNNPMGACPRCDGLGQRELLRSQARRRLPQSVARLRRGQRAGTGATSSTSRCCRPSPSTTASTWMRRSRACPRGSRTSCCTARAGEDPLHLQRRARRPAHPRASLRRNPPQPGAALQGDGFAGRARGAGQVPQHPALPGVRRHAPARRGAPCVRRRPHDLRPEPAAARRRRRRRWPGWGCPAQSSRSPRRSCARSWPACSS